jgi:hypothetical protein
MIDGYLIDIVEIYPLICNKIVSCISLFLQRQYLLAENHAPSVSFCKSTLLLGS